MHVTFAQVVTALICWTLASFLFASPLIIRGLRRPLIRPVHPVGNLRQHVGHDLSELGGLSQSNHIGPIA